MEAKNVVVIGAGPGGLASAMLLARRGFRVQVFEKAPRVGGRTAEVSLGPYRFDLGPTFLMMKFLLDELFEDAGRQTADYLDCRALDPMYRLNFSDKTMLAVRTRGICATRLSARFLVRVLGWINSFPARASDSKKLYPCLQKDYGSPAALLHTTLLAALPHIAPGRSLYDVLSKYFRSEQLRLAFTFQSPAASPEGEPN